MHIGYTGLYCQETSLGIVSCKKVTKVIVLYSMTTQPMILYWPRTLTGWHPQRRRLRGVCAACGPSSVWRHKWRNGSGMPSFTMVLSLKAKGKDRLELSVPIGFRLVLLFFFFLLCVLLLSSDLSGQGINSSVLPLILCIVTGLGAFYEERWIFDRKRGVCENRFGLVHFHRRRSIPFDEIDRRGASFFHERPRG